MKKCSCLRSTCLPVSQTLCTCNKTCLMKHERPQNPPSAPRNNLPRPRATANLILFKNSRLHPSDIRTPVFVATTMGVHRITKTFAIIWFMELTLMLFIAFLDFVDWPFHPFVCLKVLLHSGAAGCIYLQAKSIRGSSVAMGSNLAVLLLNLAVVIVCLLNLLFAFGFIASVATLVLASILL